MRPRFVMFLLVSVAMMLALIFWLRPRHGVIVSMPLPEAAQTTNPVPPGNAGGVPQRPFLSAPPTNSTAGQSKPVTNNRGTLEDLREVVKKQNIPIEFYGKVIDQDSNAVSAAKIKIGIRHWTALDPALLFADSKQIELEQTSDADGRFEFHGATGDGFGVGITKDGYELEPNRYGFGPTAGSSDNPVIFKMWSTNVHEHLIGGDNKFQIVPDGRPYFINLTDGTISESMGGDLKVWIRYTNQIVDGQLYDWSCAIEVVNGGLLEEGLGSAMYEAPSDGYVPAFQFKGQLKGGQRGDIGERQFYVQLKSGHEYGQVKIGLYAPFNDQIPGLIRLSYVVNPSGSRVLR